MARSTKAATATVKAAASSTTVKTAVAGRVTFTVGGRRIGTVALAKGAEGQPERAEGSDESRRLLHRDRDCSGRASSRTVTVTVK